MLVNKLSQTGLRSKEKKCYAELSATNGCHLTHKFTQSQRRKVFMINCNLLAALTRCKVRH